MADIDGHGLINIKAEKVSGGGIFIIIRGLDIGLALDQGGDGGKRIRAVDIHDVSGL